MTVKSDQMKIGGRSRFVTEENSSHMEPMLPNRTEPAREYGGLNRAE